MGVVPGPVVGECDVVVVGSGPNGLAAACVAAAAGLSVEVFEAHSQIGGGARTAELITPGVVHDVCSAVHPLAAASPFFDAFGLAERGVRLVCPPVQFAHAVSPTHVGVVTKNVQGTAHGLAGGPAGRRARDVWVSVFEPLAMSGRDVAAAVLGDPRKVPERPGELVKFGAAVAKALRGSRSHLWWHDRTCAAVFAGAAAHAVADPRLPGPVTVGVLLTALAQSVGWPFPVGGSQAIVDAMKGALDAAGVRWHTGITVTSLGQLPKARAVLMDTSPHTLLSVCGNQLPEGYRRQLTSYQHGPGAFKVDCVLSEPVPWRHRALRKAGTVHLGGSLATMVAAEKSVAEGIPAQVPFVMVSQPSIVDGTRGPWGRHTLWAYAHVPYGSDHHAMEQVLDVIEAHAPGFRDTIVAKSSHTARALASYNLNYVGGDIACGATTLKQLVGRPALRRDPYRTPLPGVYLCSAATPPGPGVHGMAGVHAMRRALVDRFDTHTDPLDLVRAWTAKATL